MKNTIPQVDEVTCDFTGKKIEYPNYLGAHIDFDLMFLDKNVEKEIKDDYREYLKLGLVDKEYNIKEHIDVDAHEPHRIEIDMSEEIAIEVYKFLMRKYPEKMKAAVIRNIKSENLKLVKSDWE